jgi:ankyrin repeat protein
MLRGINKARADDACRLLQCLTVAVRPLHVEELAELLAFDFEASSSKGIPTLKEDWRWDDQEEAILSTCSSLISIVRIGHSRVVQFSHFSVKEYLTSPRLARSPHGDGAVSQFHIDLKSAHTIMAQACLGTLLRPDEPPGDNDAKGSPLVKYAAEHWMEHARFENVSSRVQDGMDALFDKSKPHFAAWLQVHDVDKEWNHFGTPWKQNNSPLYYAAFCGFYDMAERLITKYPEQVNAYGGRNLAPLPAALCNRHFYLANLLHKHGADVDCRGKDKRTPLLSASIVGSVDVMRWLLNHGADANTRSDCGITPLHWAVYFTQIECVQMLLGHRANINIQDDVGQTPLYWTARRGSEHTLDIARRLLEHGTDPNIRGDGQSTPLHEASSVGLLEVVRLLLSYGAKVDAEDREYRTPSQVSASGGHHEITKLLLEHGAVPTP